MFTRLTNLIVLIFITSFLFAVQGFCQDGTYYSVVCDAGSSGTRAYLYEVTKENTKATATTIPLKNNKIVPGLANISPKDAGAYIYPLMNEIVAQINNRPVEFNLFATAGMRMLPYNKQQEIYQVLKAFIQQNYSSKGVIVKNMQTITGEYEGAFDWISVNALEHTLTNPDKSYGIHDMGGASTEVAFYVSPTTIIPDDNKISFKIEQRQYTLFSYSGLGLGENVARSQYLNDGNCFPYNYKLPNGKISPGNEPDKFVKAKTDVEKLLCIHNVPDIFKYHVTAKTDFVAFSGFYDTLVGLQEFSDSELDQETVSIQKFEDLATKFTYEDWNSMGSDPNAYRYNFAAALAVDLLYRYGFTPENQLIFADKIDNNDITWTLGAEEYLASGNTL